MWQGCSTSSLFSSSRLFAHFVPAHTRLILSRALRSFPRQLNLRIVEVASVDNVSGFRYKPTPFTATTATSATTAVLARFPAQSTSKYLDDASIWLSWKVNRVVGPVRWQRRLQGWWRARGACPRRPQWLRRLWSGSSRSSRCASRPCPRRPRRRQFIAVARVHSRGECVYRSVLVRISRPCIASKAVSSNCIIKTICRDESF